MSCWRPYCPVGVHIVLLASIIVLLASILWCWRPYCADGVPAVLVLLLANLYYFLECCCWRSCSYWLSCCWGVLAVASVPADPGVPILAGDFAYFRMRHINYQTIGLWLSDCNFFLLPNYRNFAYCTGEFMKLSDYRISDQGLNLSDCRISDSKNYRLPTSL
jgi:hypothetical protein